MTAASTPDRADVRCDPEVAGQLAADLQEHGLDLAQLQARINAISDAEGALPLTDEYLEEIENIRAATSEVLDAVTRARIRAVLQGVRERWTYERIGKATGLSKSRIGQIAPRRPRA